MSQSTNIIINPPVPNEQNVVQTVNNTQAPASSNSKVMDKITYHCNMCNQILPAEKFYKNSFYKCKSCLNQYQKARRKNLKERAQGIGGEQISTYTRQIEQMLSEISEMKTDISQLKDVNALLQEQRANITNLTTMMMQLYALIYQTQQNSAQTQYTKPPTQPTENTQDQEHGSQYITLQYNQ